MPRRLKVRREIPDLHLVTIIITGGLISFCLIGYFFAPSDKARDFINIVVLLIGFLTGKLSNAFGKPILPDATDQRTDQQVADDDHDQADRQRENRQERREEEPNDR